MSKLLAVHFLTAHMRPHMGSGKPWTVGETRSIKGDLVLCERGFHYCHTWADALFGNFLYGPNACVVEVDDDGPKDEHKGCSRTRKLIHVVNVEREMRLFAADEASRCLKAWEKSSGKKANPHSWSAIKAAKAFALGGISADDLSAAASAAESAAVSAEWSATADAAASAAESAEWSAARSAAKSAAKSAAWSATSVARSAAESAAWSAAKSAAESAAKSAAESAAWSAMSATADAAASAAESAAWAAAASAAASAAWAATWSAASAARAAAWSAAWSASAARFAAVMGKATGYWGEEAAR